MRRVTGAFLIISLLAFLFSCSSAPKGKPEESNEVKNQAAEYAEFGNRFYYKAQYSQALSFFEMALEENISVYNEPGIARSYNSIGKVYLASGRTEDAMESYSQAYSLAQSLEDPILLAECENNIGEVYLRTGETEKALEMFLLALDRNGEEDNKKAILYHNTGHAYKKSGNIEKAEELFNRALTINLEEKDLENAAGNYYALSSVYSKKEKYTEAIAHMEMALEYDKKAENSKGIAKDLLALGLIHEKAGNHDLSYEYFKKTFLVHRSLELYRELVDILAHLERLAVKTGHTEEAEAYGETLKNLTSQLDSQ